jgi:HSP20 family protein
MNLIRTNSWGLVSDLSREVDRLLHQPTPAAARPRNWVPRVDIRETDDSLVIQADVPGIKPEDFAITLDGGVLTLQGSRQLENESDVDGFHRIERAQGTFRRQFRLPETTASEGLSADYSNGILSVTIPKQAKAEPYRVAVQVH